MLSSHRKVEIIEKETPQEIKEAARKGEMSVERLKMVWRADEDSKKFQVGGGAPIDPPPVRMIGTPPNFM